uniref:Uncharacterized protein n=1 Tax=Romanomermis culicivorax TaxID=13658 RepID=A0A915I9X2_ROMCU
MLLLGKHCHKCLLIKSQLDRSVDIIDHKEIDTINWQITLEDPEMSLLDDMNLNYGCPDDDDADDDIDDDNHDSVIVQFLTACLSKSIFSREENFDQLINFASCLLDAQSTGTFQRWEKFRGEINRLENVITSTILMVDLWIKNEELQRLKKIGGKNKRNDYCIETLLL